MRWSGWERLWYSSHLMFPVIATTNRVTARLLGVGGLSSETFFELAPFLSRNCSCSATYDICTSCCFRLFSCRTYLFFSDRGYEVERKKVTWRIRIRKGSERTPARLGGFSTNRDLSYLLIIHRPGFPSSLLSIDTVGAWSENSVEYSSCAFSRTVVTY